MQNNLCSLFPGDQRAAELLADSRRMQPGREAANTKSVSAMGLEEEQRAGRGLHTQPRRPGPGSVVRSAGEGLKVPRVHPPDPWSGPTNVLLVGLGN